MIWSGKSLSEALGVEVDLSLSTGELQFNSKEVNVGELFIALKGNTNGHLYVQDAIKQGAAAAIVERNTENIPLNQQIIVKDTTEALTKLALYKRKNSKAKFIAITGSVGKTSTKEALKLILSKFGKIFASRGNFNNHLGVPINLASMRDDTEYAIFEIGMNHSGEIRELTKIIKPHLAIITNISEAHIGFFKNVEEIADAKCEIFEGLDPDGLAVINVDSQYYDRVYKNIRKLNIKNIYTFGEHKRAYSKLLSYKINANKTYLEYQISDPNNGNTSLEEYKVILDNLFPKHYAVNFAACLLITSLLNLDSYKATKSLNEFEINSGRGRLINAQKNNKKFQLICDYYNASPESVKASLSFLKHLNYQNKVVILGDMLELGSKSMLLHTDLVPFIIDSGASKILLVGSEVEFIKDTLPENLYIKLFSNVNFLIENLEKILEGEELILIKGSRGMKLEKILEYFDMNPGKH